MSIHPFPAIANRVLAMLSASEPDIPALVAVIEKDPGFGAEILRMANSPVFSVQGTIKNLAQAISQLGLDALRSISFAAGMSSAMKTFLGEQAALDACVYSAVRAVLAKRFGPAPGFACEACTPGLPQDAGRPALRPGVAARKE